MEKDKTEKDYQDVKTLKQNENLIKQAKKKKFNRHVKLKNEPVFDGVLSNFHHKYSVEVASRSALEIIKLVKSDEF